MKKLAYLISHGHTARGALQTGLLHQLVKSGIHITVIGKESSDHGFSKLVSEQGADLQTYKGYGGRWQYLMGNLRGYVHQDLRKNPALWEKHLRKVDASLSSKRRIILARLYHGLGSLMRNSVLASKIFRFIERNTYQKEEASTLLSNLNPDLIVSTRPVDDMEVELLRAAEILGIPKVMYILSWDNITSKGFFPVLADHYLTWGPVMNDELAEYYQVAGHRIYNKGVTHFDIHAMIRAGSIPPPADLFAKIGLDRRRPYLFFTMSASYYAPNEIDIIEALAGKVQEDYFGCDMQLVIRPHMVNLMADRSDLSWLKRLENIVSDRVKVDFPDATNSLLTWYMKQDDMIRLSALLNGAAVCLNSGSTIAIEAVYLDRPVILTPFDTEKWPYWRSARRLMDYLHLKKFVATGACVVAQDLEDMYRAIWAYLKEPSLHAVQRQHAMQQECYSNDGRATKRFVENIKKILAEA
jgi:hypothetical protein